MKAEDNLMKKIGKEHPFKVPEGYFEHFSSELMTKLPEKERALSEGEEVTTWAKLKPLVYMAAMFVGAALIIRVASSEHKISEVAVTSEQQDMENVSDQMIDFAVEGSMMDDYSLYVYLNDASGE